MDSEPLILLDFPTRDFGEVGTIAQALFKYCWQKAAEVRGSKGRPLFLWMDEAQEFITEYDRRFQSTAREARVASVYITQSRSGFDAMIQKKAVIDALLGNLVTKIFCANSDVVTNEWASAFFSKDWKEQVSTSDSEQDPKDFTKFGMTSMGINVSKSITPKVLPIHFSGLRKGGPMISSSELKESLAAGDRGGLFSSFILGILTSIVIILIPKISTAVFKGGGLAADLGGYGIGATAAVLVAATLRHTKEVFRKTSQVVAKGGAEASGAIMRQGTKTSDAIRNISEQVRAGTGIGGSGGSGTFEPTGSKVRIEETEE